MPIRHPSMADDAPHGAPRATPPRSQMILRILRRAATLSAFTAVLAGCNADSSLKVENPDNPDVKRAYGTPDGIEAIVRGGFSQILGATHGTSSAIQPAAMVIALESYGSVANFGMNLRAAIPRLAIDNNLGNPTATENNRDFSQLSLRGRTVSNAIGALDKLKAAGGSLGSAAADARARSFGFFVVALANGELALAYDSVGVMLPAMATDEIPGLSDYKTAMATALSQLDSAIAVAQAAAAAGNSFSIPGSGSSAWLRTGSDISTADYVRILRSVKARFRAGVARNPAERAAVDWSKVVDDAANGIQRDIQLDMNANEGWGNSWLNQAMVLLGWHGMTPYIIGMADTSGAYDTWLAAPRGNRSQFLIVTPDRRFPQGETRATQQANSPAATAELPRVYFRNRPAGEDTQGDAWGNSMYDFVRFRAYRQNSSTGPWIWFSRAENDMLRAEGLIKYLNRAGEAVDLVNRTRVANGLAPFPAGATVTTRAPAQPGGGSGSCVPRTPTGPGGATECGTLYEAMKWEKRMETIFTGWLQWFQDHRGWGDLPVGSSQMWPVPYQEMQARLEPFYNGPPIGKETDPAWVATSNTYGFGTGSR